MRFVSFAHKFSDFSSEHLISCLVDYKSKSSVVKFKPILQSYTASDLHSGRIAIPVMADHQPDLRGTNDKINELGMPI